MTDVERLAMKAAKIGSTGNGLPMMVFTEVAEHVLSNLVGYRESRDLAQQDTDYLARILQAAYSMDGLGER